MNNGINQFIDAKTGKTYSEYNLDEVVDLLNGLTEFKNKTFTQFKPILCYHCKYCFRDDWYGVCCENKNCEHYTSKWDLPIEKIKNCEYFEEEG